MSKPNDTYNNELNVKPSDTEVDEQKEKDTDTVEPESNEDQPSNDEQKSEGEKVKLRRINKALTSIGLGDSSLEDIEEDWLKEAVKEKLASKEKKEVDLEEVAKMVKSQIQQEKEAESFQNLQVELNNMNLEKEKVDALNSKYTELREKGLNKMDALKLAMEVNHIDSKQSNSIPVVATPNPVTKAKAKETPDEIVARIMKLKNGSIS